MSTTLSAHGGGAQPARIDSSGKVTGGAAMRVYGFASEAEALAAGFVCEGGPAMSVALITDAQLASGAWKLDGDPFAVVIYTAPDSLPTEGGFAVPVYPVNGWGSAGGGTAPLFDSAEIGTVNASTLAVTFDQDVSAADYSDGVTIKVNGTATSITSATRQSNHAVVYYVIPVLWHGSGDAVTWEYAGGSGNIVAESDTTPLGNVSAQNVTNNCEYAALLDLQADTLILSDGDPVSTWADQSGNGRDFTQTGSARPVYRSGGGIPYIEFTNQWMLGGHFANDPTILTILTVSRMHSPFSYSDIILTKLYDQYNDAGWMCWQEGNGFTFQDQGVNGYGGVDIVTGSDDSNWHVRTVELFNRDVADGIHSYVDGDNSNENHQGFKPVTTISNDQPVRIGTEGASAFGGLDGDVRATFLYSPVPSATNRAALEARLAARYGVTP